MLKSRPCKTTLRARQGAAYILVLGVSMLVAALAYGALLVTRAKGRLASELGDAAIARQYARDAIELGRVWISNDPDWRTTQPSGVWVSNQAIGSGTFTLEASDPLDGNVANWPHDPLVLKVTAQKGYAKHILQVTLQADPIPVDGLSYALHAAGEFKPYNGILYASGHTIYCNGNLHNDAVLNGNVITGTVSKLGVVNGAVTNGAAALALPPSSVINIYESLGTLINPGTSLDEKVLGPGRNPYGVPNANGVYVVRPSGNFTIKNSRIYGTLVVIPPAGNKVIVDNSVLLHASRADFPTLLIQGDAEFKHQSVTTFLEWDVGNCNPAGAPYGGITDNDTSDSYPSEIRGLVHVTGQVTLLNSAFIRGVLLGGKTGAGSVTTEDSVKLTYTSSLRTNPPLWYTKRVDMPIQRGSWLQLAN